MSLFKKKSANTLKTDLFSNFKILSPLQQQSITGDGTKVKIPT